MSQYEVAGLIINIESDTTEPLKYLNKFLLMEHRDVDLNITIKIKKVIEVPEGNIISIENITTMLKKNSDQGGFFLYIKDIFSGRILVLMDIDQDWRNVVITYCEYNKEVYRKFVYDMIGVAFRYSLIHFDGLVIHSSTLKWNGKGLMFSAPSETGKSTHVMLWQKYLDDVIVLNDDTPAVRIINNKLYVFGTPWSGSKFIYSNDSAPLAAIVLLEQAQNNVIRTLTSQEVISKLLPRVFLPYFDQNMVSICMNSFEKVMVSVPIYFLQCRPDKDAMELVYQWVK